MTAARRTRLAVVLVVLVSMLAALGCQPTRPLPQPRRVVDPSTVDGAVVTPRWDIAAVAYEHFGQGMDYAEAGLAPVFLVFRNKSLQAPVVQVEEVRGQGVDGEYLAYSLEEATSLVFASESFRNTAYNAGRSAALGSFLGAGLGALIGTIGGGDNIWKGAAIGAAGGALAGGAAGAYGSSERDLKQVIRRELTQYGWNDEPLPSDYTRVGYLYFPADRGVSSVSLVVRVGGEILSYKVPVANPAAKTDK
ncbi:hypothetical protein GGQ74_000638 [Desulfobaculum xiamenense]|uniref:Glycine zipper domain-containing protein n=1 Tax=Desulfobaculum xiamenense TaxID=995050 RepID=A0A846QF90_9BACT|nr:hypothetical protein [Desulfobaculum xiamenense]NJB66998.1 hypothetical protein [Desulfobaculum xiamenense]